MKTGHTYAEASQMTHMNCDMLDHATPFPMAPLPAVLVALAIAVPNPVIAVDNPPGADEMGSGDDLNLHHQVSNKSN